MKNIITLYTIIIAFIGLSNMANAQNVNIPDANFKTYLLGNSFINTNGDGEIQVSEASAFSGTITLNYWNISDLTGIEAFTALTKLDCSVNHLTNLNVSANTALTELNCSNNLLTSLDISSNTALTLLWCKVNQLTSLNVSANTGLTYFSCYGNQLTSLNVSANTALTGLDCHLNQLTSLDVSFNTSLTDLYCIMNQFTSLDVSANTALTDLNCGFNQLMYLDVSTNTALTELYCYHNQLTSLDVSSNTALKYLCCGFNQLTGLNVSANTDLIYLDCGTNQLTGLDVSGNTALTVLRCRNNQLLSLDVSGNTALTDLECFNNKLTVMNVKNGNNTNFTWFIAYNNPNLMCIQVDNATYSNNNWATSKDVTASYSENCTITGIAKLSNDNEMMIYPNPGNGVFTLTTNQQYESKLKIEIVDVAGQLVKTINEPKLNAGINSLEIDISELSNGIYFLKVYNDSFNQTLKVFKKQ